jgi:hypothetical protein
MVWLPTHPLPFQLVVSLSQPYCVSTVELTVGREGEGVAEEQNQTTARKPNNSILSDTVIRERPESMGYLLNSFYNYSTSELLETII